jgi:hypothetical protein
VKGHPDIAAVLFDRDPVHDAHRRFVLAGQSAEAGKIVLAFQNSAALRMRSRSGISSRTITYFRSKTGFVLPHQQV